MQFMRSELNVVFRSRYERRKAVRGEMYGENDYVCRVAFILFLALLTRERSLICKLYSDYLMPKSIHTVAMRRKVNKHWSTGNDKGLMTYNFLVSYAVISFILDRNFAKC